MKSDVIIKRAADVLRIEAKALLAMIDRLDHNFVRAVELMRCVPRQNRCYRSGQIRRDLPKDRRYAWRALARRPFFSIPATLCTVTSAWYVEDDLVLAVSNSGETDEILKLLPHFKRHGIKLMVITGNPDSTLAKAGDVVLDVRVNRGGLSTLARRRPPAPPRRWRWAMLLQWCYSKKKDLRKKILLCAIPADTFGRRLLLRVEDLMYRGAQLPVVQQKTLVRDALFEITSKRLGVTGVTDANGKLVGIITDGDLRRGLERKGQILELTAEEIMTREPKTVSADTMATEAMAVMERFPITSLFVLDARDCPVGVIHLHDLVKAGI